MAKKIFNVIFKIIIFIFVYLLQIYVINNTMFFGVNGDLCLMAVVLIALLEKNYTAYIVAGVCGILSDVLFSTVVCKYLVIYIIVVSALIGVKKMYKQDSKLAIIVFSVLAVAISEIIIGIFNLFTVRSVVNIFVFLLNIFKQSIINVCLAFVIYLVFNLVKKEG